MGGRVEAPLPMWASVMSSDGLYARLNPELSFEWVDANTQLDSKDPRDLANLEAATREFLATSQAHAMLERVRGRLLAPREQLSDGSAAAEVQRPFHHRPRADGGV